MADVAPDLVAALDRALHLVGEVTLAAIVKRKISIDVQVARVVVRLDRLLVTPLAAEASRFFFLGARSDELAEARGVRGVLVFDGYRGHVWAFVDGQGSHHPSLSS